MNEVFLLKIRECCVNRNFSIHYTVFSAVLLNLEIKLGWLNLDRIIVRCNKCRRFDIWI